MRPRAVLRESVAGVTRSESEGREEEVSHLCAYAYLHTEASTGVCVSAYTEASTAVCVSAYRARTEVGVWWYQEETLLYRHAEGSKVRRWLLYP